MRTKEQMIELLRELCLEFGPTGCEAPVESLIRRKLPTGVEYKTDRLGNLIVHIPNEGAPKMMVCAHMDEVGLIINEITDDGYLKFTNVGGIEPSVLCGKHVTVEGKATYMPGVIASKAIHHQSREDEKKVTPIKDMYIDIGAKDKADAESMTGLGYYAAFDSEFRVFGENSDFIKSKAIDDRIGCAIMLELIDNIGDSAPFDLYFCFTVREEISFSGARTLAQTIKPNFAIVIESTAAADVPGVPDYRRVAIAGEGGAISLCDRATIYDKDFVRFALDTAKKNGIPAQIKKYVSGGNDAGNIHKAAEGVRCIAISAPSRYIHSPASVISANDYFAMAELIEAIIKNGKEL